MKRRKNNEQKEHSLARNSVRDLCLFPAAILKAVRPSASRYPKRRKQPMSNRKRKEKFIQKVWQDSNKNRFDFDRQTSDLHHVLMIDMTHQCQENVPL